jgi:hypothetical protein
MGPDVQHMEQRILENGFTLISRILCHPNQKPVAYRTQLLIHALTPLSARTGSPLMEHLLQFLVDVKYFGLYGVSFMRGFRRIAFDPPGYLSCLVETGNKMCLSLAWLPHSASDVVRPRCNVIQRTLLAKAYCMGSV